MNKETYKEIIEKFKTMEKIVDGDFSEIEELKKDPKVQRYLYLMDLKNDYDLSYSGKRSIISKIIEEYQSKIEHTNNIWVMLIELNAKRARDFFDVSDDIGDDEIVVAYRNLENRNRIVVIRKENQERFEATNKVAYGNTQILDCFDRYYNTSYHFFEDLINNGQEYAVENVLKR